MSKKQGKKGKTLEKLLEEALVPEEEQPYPVPENWVWVRLKSLNDNKLSQKSIEPSKYADEIFKSKDVIEYPIPLPPLPEQKRIVQRVESLLDKINEAKQLIGLEEKLNQLKQSILLKAFRGELGTNNPGEESAIELLKETLLKQIKPTTKNQEKNVQQELEFN